MELKIIEKRENPLLHRLEVQFEVVHIKDKTPTREDVRNLLAANLNAEKNRVVLERMHTSFGAPVTRGFAKIYESVEHALKTEPEYVLLRNKLIEKKEEE
ncbi:MAG: 30S ribosomal protein S24e [Thermoplasmata archaeon]|nr:30S ribosomal protein S24e [Thermoplasmata archaeon]